MFVCMNRTINLLLLLFILKERSIVVATEYSGEPFSSTKVDVNDLYDILINCSYLIRSDTQTMFSKFESNFFIDFFQ